MYTKTKSLDTMVARVLFLSVILYLLLIQVICLQEVQKAHYEDFFRPKLHKLGESVKETVKQEIGSTLNNSNTDISKYPLKYQRI